MPSNHSSSSPPIKKKKVEPTWFVVRVIKVNVEGVAAVTDDFSWAGVVLDTRGGGRIIPHFFGFNLNRRLLIPISNREKFIPMNRTFNTQDQAQKKQISYFVHLKGLLSTMCCTWLSLSENTQMSKKRRYLQDFNIWLFAPFYKTSDSMQTSWFDWIHLQS